MIVNPPLRHNKVGGEHDEPEGIWSLPRAGLKDYNRTVKAQSNRPPSVSANGLCHEYWQGTLWGLRPLYNNLRFLANQIEGKSVYGNTKAN